MSGVISAPDNLVKWDAGSDALAPLTPAQKSRLLELEEEITGLDPVNFSRCSINPEMNLISIDSQDCIRTYQNLLDAYNDLEERFAESRDQMYLSYIEQLHERRNDCRELYTKVQDALMDFATLSKQYCSVSEKTSSLHQASEQLIADQVKLNDFVEQVTAELKFFQDAQRIMDKLDAPTLSVNSEIFFEIMDTIDTNMDFMQEHQTYKESATYLVIYRHCQSKAVTLIQNYIFKLVVKATDSILNPTEDILKNPDAAMALFYGRFQSILPKVKPVIEKVESKSEKRQEYDALLNECHHHYLSRRGLVLGPSIQKGLNSVKDKYNGDHCSLVRHSCALLLHASVDEHRLFYQFFSKPSSTLVTFSENLCTALYDTLRPFVVHINHLETLAEICCILRIEMLDEHVQNNSEPLQGFGNVCLQLLHDVQERLVFRAHLYLQSDVAGYNPSPGDLAYPEKLKMMEDIAESIREEGRQMRMKRISLLSLDSNTEPISRTHLTMDPMYQRSSNMGNSPADLHGMWYPTVRRTLVCLSRLYRCVDRPVFQSLSQEAISLCVQSIEDARQKIQNRSSVLDAELFQIKHLLILREQIAPFQVDFTVKEYSLDFSKVKTAAFGLLEKRSRLFALSNNALLEFLLEGAPQMKEQLIDSRKHVDAKLKSTCQRMICHVTDILIEPISKLLDEAKDRRVPGTAQDVAAIIAEVIRALKFKLPGIQQAMQLYLANRETESILFRPIKNNVVAAFAQLSQLLSTTFGQEELLLIGCPLPEQISVMLNSSILLKGKNGEESEATDSKRSQRSSTTDPPILVDTPISTEDSIPINVPVQTELSTDTAVTTNIPTFTNIPVENVPTVTDIPVIDTPVLTDILVSTEAEVLADKPDESVYPDT